MEYQHPNAHAHAQYASHVHTCTHISRIARIARITYTHYMHARTHSTHARTHTSTHTRTHVCTHTWCTQRNKYCTWCCLFHTKYYCKFILSYLITLVRVGGGGGGETADIWQNRAKCQTNMELGHSRSS